MGERGSKPAGFGGPNPKQEVKDFSKTRIVLQSGEGVADAGEKFWEKVGVTENRGQGGIQERAEVVEAGREGGGGESGGGGKGTEEEDGVSRRGKRGGDGEDGEKERSGRAGGLAEIGVEEGKDEGEGVGRGGREEGEEELGLGVGDVEGGAAAGECKESGE